MSEREFCKKCSNPKCRQRTVGLATIPYTIQFDHDGRKYVVDIPALVLPRCSACGNIVLDDHASREISAAFRLQAGLLSPEQIRESRLALGLQQQELAQLLGIAVSTLSRWETGAQIQQRSLDRLLRLFFDLREVRNALATLSGNVHQIPQATS